MIDEATGEKYLIKTQIEFDNLINETRNKLPKVIDQIVLNLDHIAQEYIKIQEQRNTHSYVNEIDEDIDEQLEILSKHDLFTKVIIGYPLAIMQTARMIPHHFKSPRELCKHLINAHTNDRNFF